MRILVLVALIGMAASAVPLYNLPPPPPPGPGGIPHRGCRNGEILHVDGTCVRPSISKNVFVFTAPEVPKPIGPPPPVPLPKVEYNLMFVRIPEQKDTFDPIVVPPPQQKSIVYVLNKQTEQGQQVIQVPPAPPSNPEVYFVNYNEGENPTLPGGIDFQTALNSAVHANGQVIGDSGEHLGVGSGPFVSLDGGNGFGGIVGGGGGLDGHRGGGGGGGGGVFSGSISGLGSGEVSYGGHTGSSGGGGGVQDFHSSIGTGVSGFGGNFGGAGDIIDSSSFGGYVGADVGGGTGGGGGGSIAGASSFAGDVRGVVGHGSIGDGGFVSTAGAVDAPTSSYSQIS